MLINLPATIAYLHAPLSKSLTAVWRAAILELQAVSMVIHGPVRLRELINSPAMYRDKLTETNATIRLC